MIKYAYADLDSIPHLAASIAESNTYQWVKKDGASQSEVFPKADLAKAWYDEMLELELLVPDEWERIVKVKLLPERVALKAVEREINNWIKTAKELTGNPNLIIKGFISGPGRKTKDIDGLEDRYQYNRYKCKKDWIPIDRKVHMDACRNHLITCYDIVKMSPNGIEADAVVIWLSENRGKEGVMLIKDKDLKQGFDTNYIDMNAKPADRCIQKTTLLGEAFAKKLPSGWVLDGNGLTFILGQMIAGDTADGYKGIKGYGPLKTAKIFEGCEDVEGVLKAATDTYYEKFPDGHEYVDWNGVTQYKTADEMAIMHCQLAYHERGGKDKSNPVERYLKGEPQLWELK